MNKKGFTLVEIIVTISLLAILAVGIGISLNKVFKNQEENTYNTFIEKVKSASLLYSSNQSSILNDLEYKKGYVVISLKDLFDNGYIRKNLKNPDTGEVIDLNEKVKIYYSADREMIAEYPYIPQSEEIVLNVLDYTTIYGSSDSNICYKGLNTNALGLTKQDGTIVPNLVEGLSIIAYMEDGKKCTNSLLNTSKLGTYKIRYVYTVNGTSADGNPDVKSAARNIVVKASKPVIKKFTVTNYDASDIYKARFYAEVSDIPNLELKYCYNYYDNNINNCKDWKILSNYTIDDKIDLHSMIPNIEDKEKVTFYLFVKNSLEQYDAKKMRNDDGAEEYVLYHKVIFNLNLSDIVYTNSSKNVIMDNPTIVSKIKNNTKFSDVMTSSLYANNKYNEPITENYYFDGWYTNSNGTGTKYTKDTQTIVKGTLNLYAKWILYNKVIFHSNATDSIYTNINMNDIIANPSTIGKIRNNTKFSDVMASSQFGNNRYNQPIRKSYYFDGWYTNSNGTGTKYTTDTQSVVSGTLNLYAKWVSDTTSPTCSITIGSPLTVSVSDDGSGVASGNWSSGNSSLSTGQHTYTVIDFAGNSTSCGIKINPINKTTTKGGYTDECRGQVYNYWEIDCYASDSDPGKPLRWTENGQKKACCSGYTAGTTTYSCPSDTPNNYNNQYCWKRNNG